MSAAALTPPVLRLLGAVYVGLFLLSFVTLHPRLRGPELAGVRRAILAWWLPASVGGLAVLGGPPVTALVFGAVGLGCFHEYLRLWPDDRHPAVDGLAAAAIAALHGLALAGALDLAAGLLAWVAAALPLTWAALRGPQGAVTIASRRILGIALCGLALAHVPALAAGPQGAPLTVLLLLTVMVNDAFQYAFGKMIGGPRLSPRLSPRKTWSGLLGGAATASLVFAVAAPSVLPVGAAEAALCGLVIAVVGLLGDLVVSAIKRDVGVKDTGAAIPGQGGLLDRCDSLLLTAPLFVHALAPHLR